MSLLIHFLGMQCPSPLGVSSMDLWPSVILVQRLWSFCCSTLCCGTMHPLPEWLPTGIEKKAIWTLFWSFRRLLMVFYMLGWKQPTLQLNPFILSKHELDCNYKVASLLASCDCILFLASPGIKEKCSFAMTCAINESWVASLNCLNQIIFYIL